MQNYSMHGYNVGETKIDARFNNNQFTQGDWVQGQVMMVGGGYAQDFGNLLIEVCVTTTDDGKKDSWFLYKYKLTEAFVIQPRQSMLLPFTFQLPFNTPATVFGNNVSVWMRTKFDTIADDDDDARDTDYFTIRPHGFKQRVLNALTQMGLQLYKVDCENLDKPIFQTPPLQSYSSQPQPPFNQFGHNSYPPHDQPGYGQMMPPQQNQFGHQQNYQQPGFNQPANNQFGYHQPPNQVGFPPPQQMPPPQVGFNQPGFPPHHQQPGHNQQASNQPIMAQLFYTNDELIQEFEFRTVNPRYKGLKELEVTFNQWSPNDLELLIQVDRHGGIFSAGGERYFRQHLSIQNFHENSFMQSIDSTIGKWLNAW